MGKILTAVISVLFSCAVPVDEGMYEEKYTIFGNLDIFIGIDNFKISSIDTIYFSKSSTFLTIVLVFTLS